MHVCLLLPHRHIGTTPVHQSQFMTDLRSRARSARAGLSAPKTRAREKGKDVVNETSAGGAYARFYSRASALRLRCARAAFSARVAGLFYYSLR